VEIEADIIGVRFQVGLIGIEYFSFTAHKKSIRDFGRSYKRRIYELMTTRSVVLSAPQHLHPKTQAGTRQ
jgi:hypothetical protein